MRLIDQLLHLQAFPANAATFVRIYPLFPCILNLIIAYLVGC